MAGKLRGHTHWRRSSFHFGRGSVKSRSVKLSSLSITMTATMKTSMSTRRLGESQMSDSEYDALKVSHECTPCPHVYIFQLYSLDAGVIVKQGVVGVGWGYGCLGKDGAGNFCRLSSQQQEEVDTFDSHSLWISNAANGRNCIALFYFSNSSKINSRTLRH